MLVASLLPTGRARAAALAWQLSDHCPGSFESDATGRCRLRTLYDRYVSAQGHGGTQVPLPPARDGFTPAQIDLGRLLFFDPLLSSDGSTSCASCHDPRHGFTDGQRRARGYGARGIGPDRSGGIELERRTPPLWNLAFSDRFFWDGRASSLEEQAAGPLFSSNEMHNTPQALQARINAIPAYRELFSLAMSRPPSAPIGTDDIAKALAAFESSLVSLGSRYDRYAHGDADALDARELRGLNAFRGFVARCSQCHTPPLFTNNQIAVVGAPVPAGAAVDIGAGAFSPDARLRGAFKVPSLRNLTAIGPPYFQAGQFGSVLEVVAFYNAPRGHALPKGEVQTLHWHVHMTNSQLTREDERDLAAFLDTLNDEALLPAIPEAVPSGLPTGFPAPAGPVRLHESDPKENQK